MELPPESRARVTRRRAELHLSFRAASAKSGLAVGTWRRAESGGGVSYQSLVHMAKALGWDSPDAVTHLIEGTDPDPTDPTTPAGAIDPAMGIAALDGQPLTDEERLAVEAFVRGMRSRRAE